MNIKENRQNAMCEIRREMMYQYENKPKKKIQNYNPCFHSPVIQKYAPFAVGGQIVAVNSASITMGDNDQTFGHNCILIEMLEPNTSWLGGGLGNHTYHCATWAASVMNAAGVPVPYQIVPHNLMESAKGLADASGPLGQYHELDNPQQN